MEPTEPAGAVGDLGDLKPARPLWGVRSSPPSPLPGRAALSSMSKAPAEQSGVRGAAQQRPSGGPGPAHTRVPRCARRSPGAHRIPAGARLRLRGQVQ